MPFYSTLFENSFKLRNKVPEINPLLCQSKSLLGFLSSLEQEKSGFLLKMLE